MEAKLTQTIKDTEAAKEEEIQQQERLAFGRVVNKQNELNAKFRENWFECVNFEICDAAAKINKYVDSRGHDMSHIYSYNKVMSLRDRKDIAKILNRTNFKLLAWYFNPRESA